MKIIKKKKHLKQVTKRNKNKKKQTWLAEENAGGIWEAWGGPKADFSMLGATDVGAVGPYIVCGGNDVEDNSILLLFTPVDDDLPSCGCTCVVWTREWTPAPDVVLPLWGILEAPADDCTTDGALDSGGPVVNGEGGCDNVSLLPDLCNKFVAIAVETEEAGVVVLDVKLLVVVTDDNDDVGAAVLVACCG